jgi:hypothetical protein
MKGALQTQNELGGNDNYYSNDEEKQFLLGFAGWIVLRRLLFLILVVFFVLVIFHVLMVLVI